MTEARQKDRIELALEDAAQMLRNCGFQLQATQALPLLNRRRARSLGGAQRIQATISSAEFDRLEQAARRLGCSRATICQYAVRAFLEVLAEQAGQQAAPESPDPVQLSLFEA